MPKFFKTSVEAFYGTDLYISVLSSEMQEALKKFDINRQCMTVCKYCCINGIKYAKGMHISVGIVRGISQFAEILEIFLGDFVVFVIQILTCEYMEHYRCIEIIEVKHLKCVNAENISFYYPLPCYQIGRSRYIMPKYYMELNEETFEQ